MNLDSCGIRSLFTMFAPGTGRCSSGFKVLKELLSPLWMAWKKMKVRGEGQAYQHSLASWPFSIEDVRLGNVSCWKRWGRLTASIVEDIRVWFVCFCYWFWCWRFKTFWNAPSWAWLRKKHVHQRKLFSVQFTERSCCNPSLGVVVEDRDEDIVTFMEFMTFKAGLVKVGE